MIRAGLAYMPTYLGRMQQMHQQMEQEDTGFVGHMIPLMKYMNMLTLIIQIIHIEQPG